jgi:integrase/recombinase XerD
MVRHCLNISGFGKVWPMTGLELRLVDGGTEAVAETVGPVEFEANCMERWQDSLTVRAYSQRTIDGSVPVLERFLARCGRAVWEVSRDDIDRVMTDLADGGLAASTRSGYLQIFKGFYAFVEQRHGVEVERRFGVVMVNPVDGFNSPTHVASGCEATPAPPTVERLEEFFGFLRDQIATARKYGTAARDYALFRTLYHAGLRSDEAACLDVSDVHLDRGPFGKLHVRFGKGTRTSGPRARWVPLLDGLDLILSWYLAEVRPRFGTGRHCSATRAAPPSIEARSAIACGWPWPLSAPAPKGISAPMGCDTRVRRITMNEAWTWSPSSSCWAIGRSGPRCVT